MPSIINLPELRVHTCVRALRSGPLNFEFKKITEVPVTASGRILRLQRCSTEALSESKSAPELEQRLQCILAAFKDDRTAIDPMARKVGKIGRARHVVAMHMHLRTTSQAVPHLHGAPTFWSLKFLAAAGPALHNAPRCCFGFPVDGRAQPTASPLPAAHCAAASPPTQARFACCSRALAPASALAWRRPAPVPKAASARRDRLSHNMLHRVLQRVLRGAPPSLIPSPHQPHLPRRGPERLLHQAPQRCRIPITHAMSDLFHRQPTAFQQRPCAGQAHRLDHRQR